MKLSHRSGDARAEATPITPGTLFRFIVGGAVSLWPRPEHSVKDWSSGDLRFARESDTCLVVASRMHKDMFGTYDILVLTSRGCLGWTTESAYNIRVIRS